MLWQGGPDSTKEDGGGNGNLKVVRGSHLFRDPTAAAPNDEALREGWLKDAVTGKPKLHPLTGEPLEIEELECPRGSVVLMWCVYVFVATVRTSHKLVVQLTAP